MAQEYHDALEAQSPRDWLHDPTYRVRHLMRLYIIPIESTSPMTTRTDSGGTLQRAGERSIARVDDSNGNMISGDS